jgi:hypothetical protein
MDLLLRTSKEQKTTVGYASLLQADIEPFAGLHFLATFETLDNAVTRDGWARGAWLSAMVFPIAHVDLRVDALRRWNGGAATNDTILLQLHGYL